MGRPNPKGYTGEYGVDSNLAEASKQRPKIALVLGASGKKGLAYIGLLKAFKKVGLSAHEGAEFPIDIGGGSSMGAMVLAFYFQGKLGLLERFFTKARRETIVKLLDFNWMSLGRLKGLELEKLINWALEDQQIEKMKTPFTAVATNMNDGSPIYIRKGPLSTALVDSARHPLLLAPEFRYVNGWYTPVSDGGLVATMPLNSVVVDGVIPEIIFAVGATYKGKIGAFREALAKKQWDKQGECGVSRPDIYLSMKIRMFEDYIQQGYEIGCEIRDEIIEAILCLRGGRPYQHRPSSGSSVLKVYRR